MICKLFVATFLLILVTASAFAAPAQSEVMKAGGLMCFSITPPKDSAARQNCDQLCAAKNAACVSLALNGAFNPAISCADNLVPDFVSVVASCRCCALAR